MDQDTSYKLPRLLVDSPLAADAGVALDGPQAHYFHAVLRRRDGDQVRAFNGRDGEWLCALSGLGKKGGALVPQRQLRPQPAAGAAVRLYFAPLKKARLDWLVEKAVELGVTHLHPVMTRNTEVRDLNLVRLALQIRESAEQCERLDVPAIFPPAGLESLSAAGPLIACLERGERQPLKSLIPAQGPVALLIGPEGGFTAEEVRSLLALPDVRPASLGPLILRAETAACMALSGVLMR